MIFLLNAQLLNSWAGHLGFVILQKVNSGHFHYENNLPLG